MEQREYLQIVTLLIPVSLERRKCTRPTRNIIRTSGIKSVAAGTVRELCKSALTCGPYTVGLRAEVAGSTHAVTHT